MKNLDKKGFLKSKKAFSLANITALIINSISFGGIMTAIGLDNSSPETAFAVAMASIGIGSVGVALGIACEHAEEKWKTPSEQVLDMTDDIKKPDEDGESKECLQNLGKISEENSYECSAE